jgi:tetratricopeptide (TPR) repeat protein
LDWEAARGIIENEIGKDAGLARKLRRVESRWQELYDEANGSPLALVHTLGLMRVRVAQTFDDSLQMLRGNHNADLQKFIFQEARRELTANDTTALNSLSFFVPSATFDAWTRVANLSRNALETTIDRLSALSLVDVLAGEERYALHPITRAFVREKLLADAKIALEIGIRFARYWVSYAELYGGMSEKFKTFSYLESEWSNLEIAVNILLDFLCKNEGVVDKHAATMLFEWIRFMSFFLSFSGRWDEHQLFSKRAYDVAFAQKDWKYAGWRAFDVAWIAYKRAQTDDALLWLDRCMDAWTHGGSKGEQATALRLKGLILQQKKEYAKAETLFLQALTIRRELGAKGEVVFALISLGNLSRERKDYDTAEIYFKDAMKTVQEIGDKARLATLCGNFGELSLDCKRWEEAIKWFQQADTLAGEITRIEGVARAKYGLARAYEAKGSIDLSLSLVMETLEVYERLKHKDLAEVQEMVKRIEKRMKAEE